MKDVENIIIINVIIIVIPHYCYHYFYWILMVNHEVWVLVVTVGVSMGGKRVVRAWAERRQQADVRLC